MAGLGDFLIGLNSTLGQGLEIGQRGKALHIQQQEMEAEAARAKAKADSENRKALFDAIEHGPKAVKATLKSIYPDANSPMARIWGEYAASEEEDERKRARAILAYAEENDLGTQELFSGSSKDMIDTLGKIADISDKKARREMDRAQEERLERHHQDDLAVSRGNLDINRREYELEAEEARRDAEFSDMIRGELGGLGGGGAAPMSAPGPTGPVGGQVTPIGQGEALAGMTAEEEQAAAGGAQEAQVSAPQGPVQPGGLTGMPKVDKMLKIGIMAMARGDSTRANAAMSAARIIADKSPEGRAANIQEAIDQAHGIELNKVLSLKELTEFEINGQPIAPGTTVGDLMGQGQVGLRPNEPLPPAVQEKLMGSLHALEFGNTMRDAVRKGVKTGRLQGLVSAAKGWLGYDNEAQFQEAQKQLTLAGQSIIPGIPSNYDMQTYQGTVPGFTDPPAVREEKLKWNEKLATQVIRTTIAYYKGTKSVIPPPLVEKAQMVGINPDDVGSFGVEDKKFQTLQKNTQARLSKIGTEEAAPKLSKEQADKMSFEDLLGHYGR